MTKAEEQDQVEWVDNYEALYNKYRPRKFSDLVGQDNIVGPMQMAVRTNKISHAYLFSGVRGTGKTTSARIFAAAINCEFSEDGEPCGECDLCAAIFSGEYVGGSVQELNATDHRGIDDMRSFLSTVNVGVSSNYKVFIIDEVHQLTKEASSLLLKTLEEPPSPKIVFILATTDPHKLLDTILSRVNHMQFRLIAAERLESLVRNVVELEGLDISEDDIQNTVAAGRGSARDTLSVLERVSMGIHAEDAQVIDSIIEGLMDGNLATILMAIAEAESAGSFNARNVGEDVLEFWRDVMVYQQNHDLVTGAPSRMKIIEQASSDHSQKAIIRNFETAASMLASMRTSGSNRIALEGGLARMLTPLPSTSRLDAILDRLDDIEGKLTDGVPVSRSAGGDSDPWKGSQDAWDNDSLSQGPSKTKEEAVEETPEDEAPAPKRRSRRGTRRSSTRKSREDVEEVPKTEEPLEPDPEPESSDKEVAEEEAPTSDQAEMWEMALDSVSGRSKILLQEGTYAVSGDSFIIRTERRLSERSREKLTNALGTCSFELIG